jgi:hypothetical protein
MSLQLSRLGYFLREHLRRNRIQMTPAIAHILPSHWLGISAVRKEYTISIFASLVAEGSNELRKREEGRDKCPVGHKDRNYQALRGFECEISSVRKLTYH